MMIGMARRARVIRLPRRPAPEADATAGFVEVRRCRHQAEALVVRSLLESEGIRVVLRSNLAQSVHPFSVGDQGEIVVLAPEHDAPRARTILIRLIR
jgi:hypothetical protein